MRLTVAAAVLALAPVAPGAAASAQARDTASVPAIAVRWEQAATFAQFVDGDTTRQAEWKRNYDAAASTVAAIEERIRALGGRWRVLVVAESWCNDAVNSVPYLARFAEKHPDAELRVLTKAQGLDLLERHRLNGRPATPLVLLYDADFVLRGAWIERPAALQQMITSKEGRVCEDTLKASVRSWRLADNGRSVLDEVLQLMERGVRAGAQTSTSTTP